MENANGSILERLKKRLEGRAIEEWATRGKGANIEVGNIYISISNKF